MRVPERQASPSSRLSAAHNARRFDSQWAMVPISCVSFAYHGGLYALFISYSYFFLILYRSTNRRVGSFFYFVDERPRSVDFLCVIKIFSALLIFYRRMLFMDWIITAHWTFLFFHRHNFFLFFSLRLFAWQRDSAPHQFNRESITSAPEVICKWKKEQRFASNAQLPVSFFLCLSTLFSRLVVRLVFFVENFFYTWRRISVLT